MTTTVLASPAASQKPRATSGVVRNVTSNWAGLVVGILVSFLVAPIVVNSLGSVYYGVWSLLMQFTGYIWLFDFGVRESVVKYVAQYHAADDHDELAATVHTAVSVYSVVALAALAAVAALTFALPYIFNIPPDAVSTARATTVLTGLTVALGFVFNVFVGVLMGLQKFYLMARLNIAVAIGRALLIVGLLYAGQGIIALAAVQLVVSILSNVIVYRLCIRDLPYLSVRIVRPVRARVVKLLNYGKYVLISNVGDKLIFATDSIVIGIFMPISALTFYAIGGSLIDHLRSFITSMASILNPLSSSLEARGERQAVAGVVMTGAKAAVLLGMPLCIGFVLLGERFITLWMGPEYGPMAGLVLALLAAGHMVGLPYHTISGVLYGLGQHRIVAWSRVGEGLANLVLSIILVRRYGLVGVAVGTAIPHAIVVACVLPFILPRLLPIRLRDYYLWTYVRPLLASVPFWGVCWFIASGVRPDNLPLFMSAVVGALPAYAVPCWYVALTGAERAHVLEGVRRRFTARQVAVSRGVQ